MLKQSSVTKVGDKYMVFTFDFEKDDVFAPISQNTCNLGAFSAEFKNFVAYCTKGQFERRAMAINMQHPEYGSLHITKINLADSLAKKEDSGKSMDLVQLFQQVQFKATTTSQYVCLSHGMPFNNTPIPRTEIEVSALKPHVIKPNSIVLLANPLQVLVNGVAPKLPYALSGNVTALVTTKIVEVVYG